MNGWIMFIVLLLFALWEIGRTMVSSKWWRDLVTPVGARIKMEILEGSVVSVNLELVNKSGRTVSAPSGATVTWDTRGDAVVDFSDFSFAPSVTVVAPGNVILVATVDVPGVDEPIVVESEAIAVQPDLLPAGGRITFKPVS